MKKSLFQISVFSIAILAFSGIEKEHFLQPAVLPKPVYDFSKNEWNKEKVLLGRLLFYEPALSADSSISCASCHSSYNSFSHTDHALSHGVYDRVGNRNSPALINLAWQKTFMWDGAVNHLDVQALAPITHSAEMGEDFGRVIKKLEHMQGYKQFYFNAYGDSNITGERTLKSISQFLLSLVSVRSKYDSVNLKLTAFTEQEKRGYALFKTQCNSCHTEPLFTNNEFENNGLPLDNDLRDFGRMELSHNRSDSAKFKVPTLRNIEFTHPYMHDGRFSSLSAVLSHYEKGIQLSPVLGQSLRHRIVLSSHDKVDLHAFLLTLSDRKFIFDPTLAYPHEAVRELRQKNTQTIKQQ